MSYKVKSKDKYKDILDQLRHENSNRWQIFGSFLTAHAIFLSFILTYAFKNNRIPSCQLGPFIASILGIFLTIPWLANLLRGIGYHNIRMAQAKEAEPYDWNLLCGEAESFTEGEEAIIDGEFYRFKWFSRIFKKSSSVKFIIYLFLIFYFVILFLNGPWWKDC